MPKELRLVCESTNFLSYVVPGSVPMKCSECGQGVWVSPSSLLLLHDHSDMKILCLACVYPEMVAHGGTIDPPTPAQSEEIAEYYSGRPNAG